MLFKEIYYDFYFINVLIDLKNIRYPSLDLDFFLTSVYDNSESLVNIVLDLINGYSAIPKEKHNNFFEFALRFFKDNFLIDNQRKKIVSNIKYIDGTINKFNELITESEIKNEIKEFDIELYNEIIEFELNSPDFKSFEVIILPYLHKHLEQNIYNPEFINTRIKKATRFYFDKYKMDVETIHLFDLKPKLELIFKILRDKYSIIHQFDVLNTKEPFEIRLFINNYYNFKDSKKKLTRQDQALVCCILDSIFSRSVNFEFVQEIADGKRNTIHSKRKKVETLNIAARKISFKNLGYNSKNDLMYFIEKESTKNSANILFIFRSINLI